MDKCLGQADSGHIQLLLLLAGLLLLDILAMRFGVDSRIFDVRDTRGWWPELMNGDVWQDAARAHRTRLHDEANVQRLVSLATVARPPLRVRLADGLRALAILIDPAVCPPGEPLTQVAARP